MARLWGVFTALCVILSLFTVAYGQGTGQKGKQTEAGDVIPGKGTKSGDVISGKSTEGGDVIRGKGTEGGDAEGGDVIPAKGTKGGDVISGKGTKGGEVIPSKGTEAGDVIPAKGTEGGDVIPSNSKFPSLSMLIKHRPPVKRSRNVCKRPKKVGRCRARIPRFYFDSASGLCVAFFYGGCGSNRNNFKTRKECARRCGCRLPAKPGRCKAAFPRYYYKWGKCVSFTYGGCNPNENNFLSKKSCLAVCR